MPRQCKMPPAGCTVLLGKSPRMPYRRGDGLEFLPRGGCRIFSCRHLGTRGNGRGNGHDGAEFLIDDFLGKLDGGPVENAEHFHGLWVFLFRNQINVEFGSLVLDPDLFEVVEQILGMGLPWVGGVHARRSLDAFGEPEHANLVNGVAPGVLKPAKDRLTMFLAEQSAKLGTAYGLAVRLGHDMAPPEQPL